MLGEYNFAVLPSMISLQLERADGLHDLDVVFAPKLRHLIVHGAHGCRVNLRHVPTARPADVEALLHTLARAAPAARQASDAEESRWRAQGTAARRSLTAEARRRQWIGRRELWTVAEAHPDEDQYTELDNFTRMCEVMLMERCKHVGDREYDRVEAEALTAAWPLSTPNRALPKVDLEVRHGGGPFQVCNLDPSVRERVRVLYDPFVAQLHLALAGGFPGAFLGSHPPFLTSDDLGMGMYHGGYWDEFGATHEGDDAFDDWEEGGMVGPNANMLAALAASIAHPGETRRRSPRLAPQLEMPPSSRRRMDDSGASSSRHAGR